MLAQTLADVRKRLQKRSKLNENYTKATLIEPVLGALGWDVLDPDEVSRESRDLGARQPAEIERMPRSSSSALSIA